VSPRGACSRYCRRLAGRARDVHISLVAGGGQGPTPATAEAGGSALQRTGEHTAAVEVASRSGAAPESTGSKRAAPEQGLLGRQAKKPQLRSKM
jgi:hypothetical protein